MSTTTELSNLVSEAQQQTLTALKQAQDLSLRASEVAIGLVPGEVSAASLPTPKQVVESTFAFAGQILEAQKDYSLRLAEVLSTTAERAPARTAKHAAS